MELKNFISQTLIELVQGVKDAQVAIKESGAIINPKVSQASLTEAGVSKVDGYNISIQKVDFNLVIEAKEMEGGKAGVSVIAGVFGAGSAIESKTDNKSINSISVSIPILFPVDDDKIMGLQNQL